MELTELVGPETSRLGRWRLDRVPLPKASLFSFSRPALNLLFWKGE